MTRKRGAKSPEAGPGPAAACDGAPADGPVRLSPRQLECLRRISLGETSAQIAFALGLSIRTVDHYVRSACAKLGVRSRAQAVLKAISLAILEFDAPARSSPSQEPSGSA